MRREFLQLADHYNLDKHSIAGYFVSAKLDGTRCLWDGGISRGLPTDEVPWASITDPKTGNRKAKIKPIATGLWSRYGNPIIAPDAFLNLLPACPLDGELWAGEGSFQLCRSICGGDQPDARFMDHIHYAVYSCPTLEALFGSGEIKNTNMQRLIDYVQIDKWIKNRLDATETEVEVSDVVIDDEELGDIGVPIPLLLLKNDYRYLPIGTPFEAEVKFLNEALSNSDISACYCHQQFKLSSDEATAKQQVEDYLEKVLARGGEGVVLRDPHSTWKPKRHTGILKYKPYRDAEATIVGFTSGRETLKGSRLLGKIGALVCKYDCKLFELSGLTDAEREFLNADMTAYATKYPDKVMPPFYQGKHFKVGDSVTFKYRELTDDGKPKEARYFRKRDEE